jgi:hypothetical protein
MGDGAASLAYATPLAPMLALTQRQVQMAAAALVLVDAAIDAFMREARKLLGALMARNLLRTPGLG